MLGHLYECWTLGAHLSRAVLCEPQVKTIGDAYVAIGGAFNDNLRNDKHEAALRTLAG